MKVGDGGGRGGGYEECISAAKSEKTFREAFNPLKNFKTAKFGNFWTQGYQGLSKTHDFAG